MISPTLKSRTVRSLALGGLLTFTLTIAALPLLAQDAKAPAAKEEKAKRKAWKDTKSPMLQDDFPFTQTSIGAKFPAGNVANKGMALILGNEAFMCFDQDLLRVAAGWTGGYITTHGVSYDGAHGAHPEVAGDQQFGTRPVRGWADAGAKFDDPRPEPFGPLPHAFAHWDGLYVNGMDVVLSYTVLGTKVYEQPGSAVADGATAFTRTFKVGQVKDGLTILACEVSNASGAMENGVATLATTDLVTSAGLVGAPKGVQLEIQDNARIFVRLPKGTAAGTFKLVLARTPKADQAKFTTLLNGKAELAAFTKGGPMHWPDAVVTKGVLGSSQTPDGAYVTDTLTPPVNNPWKRRIRFGGMDFFADGKRAALSTWDGDIWIVSGIDDKLENLTWHRFASGGFDLLGLRIVDDVVYAVGRNQITRYHDLNNDGEADYYENFNDDVTASQGFHEFAFDLQTDKQGNFYFAKAGPVRGGGRGFGGGGGNGDISASAGTLMKVSKDGRTMETYATGFRAPNGICVGPDGQVTTGDNEGTWVPACPINWVKPGGFYGVETLAHKDPIPEFNKPLCWISKAWDNSGGGQAWVTSDKWGPFKGELLHTSYGQSALYLVLKQAVGSQMQGGIVRFPVKFTSSAMRPRFNPKDGQLYIAGLRGWQSNAANETGFDRVRYTGKPVYMVSGLTVDTAGVHLTFTQPLDPKESADVQNYSGQRWNYQRTSEYGSPEFSVSDPSKRGHDNLNITSAKLSADGKTVTLQIEDLKPANEMLLRINITAKDGTVIKQDVQHTIHVVPPVQTASAN